MCPSRPRAQAPVETPPFMPGLKEFLDVQLAKKVAIQYYAKAVKVVEYWEVTIVGFQRDKLSRVLEHGILLPSLDLYLQQCTSLGDEKFTIQVYKYFVDYALLGGVRDCLRL